MDGGKSWGADGTQYKLLGLLYIGSGEDLQKQWRNLFK